jgi:DNA-binding transcriptional LysR family regulator
MSPTFGIGYILPLLPEFAERYPLIRPEWTFENRQLDLIAEVYATAIGGGFERTPGVIARTLAPLTSSRWLRLPTWKERCRRSIRRRAGGRLQ